MSTTTLTGWVDDEPEDWWPGHLDRDRALWVHRPSAGSLLRRGERRERVAQQEDRDQQDRCKAANRHGAPTVNGAGAIHLLPSRAAMPAAA